MYFARTAICPPPDSALVDDARAAEYAELRSPIPQDYHNLLGVLSKRKRTPFLPRRPHDHNIDLMDHTTPYGPIDSLSDISNNYENLNNQFIRPSQSSTGPPVLFIRKKDGSLHLAIDDRGLNKSPKSIGIRSRLSLVQYTVFAPPASSPSSTFAAPTISCACRRR